MAFEASDLERELLLLIHKAHDGGTSTEDIAAVINDACTRLDAIVNPEPPPEEDSRGKKR